MFNKYLFLIIQIIGISSLHLHFSGFNYNFFVGFQKHIKISIGGIIELLPLVIIGLIFGSFNFLLMTKKFPLYLQVILFSLIILLFKYDLFIYYQGFLYPNVFLNICASTFLFLLFSSFNLKKLLTILTVLQYTTKFTGGIYYCHPIFNEYLKQNIYFFKKQTYISSLAIYINLVFLDNFSPIKEMKYDKI